MSDAYRWGGASVHHIALARLIDSDRSLQGRKFGALQDRQRARKCACDARLRPNLDGYALRLARPTRRGVRKICSENGGIRSLDRLSSESRPRASGTKVHADAQRRSRGARHAGCSTAPRDEGDHATCALPRVEEEMTLDLSIEEARFLRNQLARHITEMEDELVHTDSRALQASLAKDFDRIREIQGRLEHLLSESEASH